ncbi:MAG: TetR/AcrR family transcriptional regulator [Spirochaetes bacterium]|nr:TetR/AcrR family transcriptional regulator [Spirochaetota bacterium]MBU1081164.1 TetR/AcrR family transcriptional regulator [Spirochaetota bacterium]
MTKRQKQAQQTRRTLFENAVALFREKGFDSVTVEEITTRAGTAKGSFYTYFRTKSDIIIEEFKAIDDFYLKYQHNLKRYGSARARISAFVRAQTRHVRDNVGVAILKILYATNISDPLAEKFLINPQRYLHSLVKEIIVFGQESGEFRDDIDADELTLLFNRSMRSVFLDWAISDDDWDLVAAGVRYCELMLIPALVGAGR